MTITNPKILLRNSTVQKLTDLSACLEKDDDVLASGSFTRSPYHLIKFLIIYAALSTDNRELTLIKVNKLATDYATQTISQHELDTLIVDIDWNSILDKANAPSHVYLALLIELNSPANFFTDAKSNCLALYSALQNPQSIVQVCKPTQADSNENKIIFRTTVKQTEEWTSSFYAKRGYWKVDGFNLSSDFLSRINRMTLQQELIAGFKVTRGALPGYELYLPLPPNKIIESQRQHGNKTHTVERVIDGDYSVKEELMPKPQLYNCFKDLTHVFGLSVIDVVDVKIENEGNINVDGVDVKQAEEAQFGESCCPSITTIEQEPTRIIAHGLNIMLRESGISAQFLKNPTETAFNDKIYILLETKSGAEVLLMNAKPDAIQSLTMMNTPLTLRSSSVKQITNVSDTNYGWFGKTAVADSETPKNSYGCNIS